MVHSMKRMDPIRAAAPKPLSLSLTRHTCHTKYPVLAWRRQQPDTASITIAKCPVCSVSHSSTRQSHPDARQWVGGKACVRQRCV